MRREPSFGLRISIEALLIVFSVLLALFLNDRWQTSRETEAGRRQLEGIRSELEENRRIVESWLKRHAEIAERVAALRAAGSDRKLVVINHQLQLDVVFGQSLIDSMLRSPSWEAAKTTGLVRMFQPELVNRLADVYSMQEEGPMRSLERIAGLLFDRASHDEAQVEQTLVLLEIHLGELIGQEHLLLASYDHVLATFDSSAE